MSTPPTKIHLLIAVAACAVIAISLVGTAAIMGWLPDTDDEYGSPAAAEGRRPDALIAPECEACDPSAATAVGH